MPTAPTSKRALPLAGTPPSRSAASTHSETRKRARPRRSSRAARSLGEAVARLSGRAPSEANELVAQALAGGLGQIASAEAPIDTLTEQIQTAHGSA